MIVATPIRPSVRPSVTVIVVSTAPSVTRLIRTLSVKAPMAGAMTPYHEHQGRPGGPSPVDFELPEQKRAQHANRARQN